MAGLRITLNNKINNELMYLNQHWQRADGTWNTA